MATEQDTPRQDDGLHTAVMGRRAEIVDDNAALEAQDNVDTPESEGSGDDGQGRKLAGRYDSVEDLENGYKQLQAEYTRVKQELKELQHSGAATQQGTPNEVPSTSNIDPELKSQLEPYIREAIAPLEEQLTQQQQKVFWKEMEAEYGAGIQQKVLEYYQQLPPEEQAQLDTMAGARLIARLVSGGKSASMAATQPTGGARSHNERRSTLTRAEIAAMSDEEYARRQPEIMRFYMSQYQET